MSGRSVISAGGLLPSDLLDRVAAGDTKLPGTSADTYGLVPGERLTDSITRSWNRLTGVWTAFSTAVDGLHESDRTATTLTRERWLRPLFDELGFHGLEPATAIEIDGKDYPISHTWSTSVPVHQLGTRLPIDRRSSQIPGAATTSPHGLVQEFLNRSNDHLWAIVTNGRILRVLRDNASLTRQAYVEFDIAAIFEGEQFSDFVLLWLLVHRSRFEGDVPAKCWLEQWANEAATTGIRALDNQRQGVEAAITALGQGFIEHKANIELRDALTTGELSDDDYQRQLLRTVYRLLFLLVAEARALLLDPAADTTAKVRYTKFYSLDRLVELSQKRRGGPHDDLWEAHQLVVSALSSDGLPDLALSPLGSFLWSPESTPDLSGARLSNRAVLDAIRSLAIVRDVESGIDRRTDFRNLGAEELGSIYESLLELHANVNVAAQTFGLATAAGNDRKTTGSYYTPTPLINELLNSALEPVLTEAARSANPEAAILDLSVIDPACGSGHFLIAAANRIAHRLAMVREGGIEPAPDQIRTALREVIANCIHGVDVNPMAVELCKISLWVEAMEPGRPLGFLDHRIVCGNSLLGAAPRLLAEGVPDDAYKALTGDDKDLVKGLKARNKKDRAGQLTLDLGTMSIADQARPWADAVARIDRLDDSDVAAVRNKQQMWDDFTRSPEARHSRLAADAWCTAIAGPKVDEPTAITTQVVRRAASGTLDDATAAFVEDVASHYRFLHLHLAFPDKFEIPNDSAEATNPDTGWSGGFDVVLGNPPWERVKLQEKEWFATADPAIAKAPNKAARTRLINELAEDNPALLARFRQAQRQAEGESHFLLKSGAFPLCGRGDVNTYSVFAETMRSRTSPTGRTGVIVPTGIATDDTTKYFFQSLVEHRSLVSLFDLENRRQKSAEGKSSAKWFDGVHSSYKFCLLTLSGFERPIDEAEFVFFGDEIAELADPDRRFTLTPEDFELLNPNTRTCPIFRSRRDAEITKGIYRRVPVLIKEGPPEENPWGVKLSTMFHMSNDSHLFRTRDDLEADGWTLQGNIFTRDDDMYLPLYEGKMVNIFDSRWGTYTDTGSVRSLTAAELCDPSVLPLPAAWIPESEAKTYNAGLAFRSISRATDARSLIATFLPPCFAGNSLVLMHPTVQPAILTGLFSSLVLDFVTAVKAGGPNRNFFIMKQLPVLSPAQLSPTEGVLPAWVVEWLEWAVMALVNTSWDHGLNLGRPPHKIGLEMRQELQWMVDAVVAYAYGLNRDELAYILESFDVLRKQDIALAGSFVTRDRILESFDRIESGQRLEVSEIQAVEDAEPAWANLYTTLGYRHDSDDSP